MCTVIWCLDLLLAEDEGPKQDLSQKLCCFGQEGGQLSGAKDGATSEALWLLPVPETAGLCIPHPHPCSLPSAESRSQGGSLRSLRQKPLGLGGPLCSHQEGGRLSGAKDLYMYIFKLKGGHERQWGQVWKGFEEKREEEK
uniref:Uncharacterized protein n=1 Tax=Mus spicilegus TaxID=10103 RepID=A0A8C6IJZ4_MUSSI